jgi:hypothetical protein
MWLFTSIGFFAVVAHRDDPDTLLVRARSRDDLEALRDRHLPALEIHEHAGADYRWRATVTRTEWGRVAATLATEIDYPNFKSAVAARQGPDRAELYHDVWGVMYWLQGRRVGH